MEMHGDALDIKMKQQDKDFHGVEFLIYSSCQMNCLTSNICMLF